ncbi:endonuclease/exonuclease/phosphatase family protein [Legionella taurinensis]|uniref:Endonuclease/exonuclease/phosphatase family protein n=2 Tax=Legionella TaxID=445 RepID=A0AB38N8M1_9GAMM|nr:endonuclease/exonuclease/phosphatase family protein [Legionella taurinensis]MDX1836516.1 endonuclease/exonuclease/phosphatase family protein [Legionella taurinensis]PUT43016.1 hypothetical protein DB744_01155 [Legionella taurinensis]PUT45165.1 hypothetical protein DB743_07395 [Legionella taurinensis]PUT45573.1 hypothetical protein DB746_01155 [Legionella taurinensis]PUT49340.1 hypothetical protein DB745_01155 [Legionella taurinensis]
MPPRLHPLFPTLDEVQKNPDLAYSDHLPILTQVPLGKGKKPLVMISLNILGTSACSGIHAKDAKEDTPKRHQRIITGLAKGIKKHKAEVLFLQEAGESVVEDLRAALGDDWEIKAEFNTGLVTCYSKKRFEEQSTQLDRKTRIRSVTVKDKDNKGLTLDFHNTWGIYSAFPDGHEKTYEALLTNTRSDVSIILGDTNSRLAPLDDAPRNIMTGVIPNELNQADGLPPDAQNGDHPDGGFYRDATGIHQLETHVLDFNSGNVVVDSRPVDEIKPHLEFRMIMCLDDSYKKSKEINDETIFEYEKGLRERLGKPDILVRMAADTFNHKAIAIRFPQYTVGQQSLPCNDFTFIKTTLPDCQFQTIEDQGQRFDCVFVPLDQADTLHSAIEAISLPAQTKKMDTMEAISRRIAELGQWHQHLMLDPSAKIESLKALHAKIKESDITSLDGIRGLVEQWEKEKSTLEINGKKIDNGALMSMHRNRFFSSHRPDTSTKSADLLQSIKK